MENILELKTINKLRELSFFIPSYQRGYRWGEKEVTDLLNDISDFSPKEIKNSDEKTWYCLQPLVIRKKENNEFEVIDGQQRLTTIYLVLYYLNQTKAEDYRDKIFELNYETRGGSSNFLKELEKDNIEDSNIDFYHISNAYNTICNWFKKPNFNRNEFESKFTFHTQVIWYETKETDPIAIFTRINIGKIPLTNAELIKALFLNSSNFEKDKKEKVRLKQLEIASEWDRIEHTLQNNRFWFFLNGDNSLTNRIELIFNLMNTNKDESDNYSTFRFFNTKFINKSEKIIENNWQEIKKYFQTFDEWFNERELYHKIGFLLVTESSSIIELMDEARSRTKKEYKTYLDNLIKDKLKKISLEELQYGDKEVKLILLLYNIQTLLNNKADNSLFPFEIFKTGNWDIEHITSIKDSIPDSTKRLQWLKDAERFIEEVELLNKVRFFDSNKKSDDDFEELFKEVVEHFNKDVSDKDLNDISNLALLDSVTNRGYKNAVFPIKRMTIIKREKEGTFIPICTKNVFLKYFSDYPPKISFWTQEDRDNYMNDLENVLKIYLTPKEEFNYE
jgi:uncharacterized protein with ParB-like and HNH nuclease domain